MDLKAGLWAWLGVLVLPTVVGVLLGPFQLLTYTAAHFCFLASALSGIVSSHLIIFGSNEKGVDFYTGEMTATLLLLIYIWCLVRWTPDTPSYIPLVTLPMLVQWSRVWTVLQR